MFYKIYIPGEVVVPLISLVPGIQHMMQCDVRGRQSIVHAHYNKKGNCSYQFDSDVFVIV